MIIFPSGFKQGRIIKIKESSKLDSPWLFLDKMLMMYNANAGAVHSLNHIKLN